MKKSELIFLGLLMGLSSSAMAEECDYINDQAIDGLANDNLSVATALNKCVYKPVTRILTPENKQSLEDRIKSALAWGDEVSANKKRMNSVEFSDFLKQQMQAGVNRRNHDLASYPNTYARNYPNPPPRNYGEFSDKLDGFFNATQSPLQDNPELRAKIKQKLIEQYVMTPERYKLPDCLPKIESSSWNEQIRTLTMSDDKANLKKYESDVKNFMEKRNITNDLENGLKVCNPAPILTAPAATTSFESPESCQISLSQNFANNEASIDVDSFLSSNAEKVSLLNDCIKRNVDKGFVLEKIQIDSSTNASLNSGAYANKPFLLLSQDRANAVKGMMSDLIKPDVLKVEPAMIETNITGSNGDGSSGPCPYDANGDRAGWYKNTHPVSKNTTSEEKELLDNFQDARQVSMHAIFKNSTKLVTNKPTEKNPSVSIKCFSISMRCER